MALPVTLGFIQSAIARQNEGLLIKIKKGRLICLVFGPPLTH